MTGAWIYEHSADDSARFVLGTIGENPLVCVGVNPSTAAPGSPDQTVSKLIGFAGRNGFDSWAMLNIYPQRSTDPAGMHRTYSPDLRAENELRITEFLDGRPLTMLAAWGWEITRRPYLPELLTGIVPLVDRAGGSWARIGAPLKTGHPRHPSRAAYALPLQPFDVRAYLRSLAA
ncbi:DUF1643 domain-containing protein [Microbacterium xylanilyticum]